MLKKIVSFGLIEGLSKALNILMMLLLPFLVTVDFFAEINILNSILVISISIFTFGLDRVILRFYNENSTTIFQNTFYKLWLKILIIAFPLFLILFIFWKKDLLSVLLGLLVLTVIIFQALRNFNISIHKTSSNVGGFLRFRLYIQLIIFILILTTSYFFNNIFIYLIVYLIAILPFIFFNSNFKKITLKNHDKKLERKMFNFSWPLIFHTLSTTLLMSVDRLILNEFLSKEKVAVYSLGYMFGASITFLYGIFNAYLEPKIISFDKNKTELREKLLSSYTSTLFIFATMGVAFLIFVLPTIIKYLYDPIFLDSIPIIVIISITHLINPFYLQANFRLMNLKSTKLIAFSSFSSAILNIVLNIYFLNLGYGIIGTAYATFISYLSLTLLISILSYKKGKIKISKANMWYIFSSFIIVILLIYNIDSKINLVLLLTLLLIIHLKNVKYIYKAILKP